MVLQALWFYLWSFLWLMYFVTDGFVLGIGAISPFVAKSDQNRRILLNTVGPVWDGNEVWLITAGAITFGAFPLVYAVLFTSLYTGLMLLLFCLIVRGVSFEFRSRLESPRWRSIWDACVFVSSLLAAILLGVVFANIFQGLPLDQNQAYKGSFFGLINVYGLLGGVAFLVLFIQHGLSWMAAKTTGDLRIRARKSALATWFITLVTLLVLLGTTAVYTDLYSNYMANPWLVIILVLTVGALILLRYFLVRDQFFRAWFASGGIIAGVALFGVTGMFPRLIPSSIDVEFSLTAFNSSAEPLSLKIMLAVICVFIPLVLVYQSFAYHIFKHTVTSADLESEEAY